MEAWKGAIFFVLRKLQATSQARHPVQSAGRAMMVSVNPNDFSSTNLALGWGRRKRKSLLDV